ncbi:MAG: ATP-binding protein, partial [Acidobacteriota bacterium]|nr:ATP-binding protein [Acidobacteriota bacterium]
ITEVMTDGDRLRAVLVNLLANAQQAVEGADSAEASDDPRIRLSTEPLEGRRVAITVSDAGVGIPPDVLPRIFDPYFTTRRTGTGLGLAIAKNIVEGLGGTIVAMTRRGQGTEFRIELGDAPAGQEL